MSNFAILVKTNFLIFWGSLKTRKKGRYAASGALLAVIILFFGFAMASQSVIQTMALIEEGVPELSIFMSLLTALTLGILFGLMRAANTPGSKDAQLLLSLPVRRVTAVCSKVVTQYIFDAPLIILILTPTVIAYYVFGQGDAGTLVRGLLLALFLPLVPIALSYLLGAGLAILKEKFKLTSVITTAILMMLLVGYMFVNIKSSSILAGVTSQGVANALSMIDAFAPLSWLTHFVLYGSVLPGFLSLLMLTVPFCLGVWLFSSRFGSQNSGYRSNRRQLLFSVRSPRRALLSKEVKRYLDCSIYVFNTAFSPLLLIVFAVVLTVIGPEKIIAGMEIPIEAQGVITQDIIYVIITGIFCMFPSMTSTTASSISLEGKQLWILKAHPVRTEDIFWAKNMLNIALLVPVSVVAALLIGINLEMSFAEILGFAAVVTLLGVLTSFLGLISNLLFPRFDWTSETAVVKQSMSVLIAMVFGFASASIPYILYFTLFSSRAGFLGFCAIGAASYGILAAAAFAFLKTKGKRIFEAL